MSLWVYPGSFDPVTLGHADIIARAARQCDRLIVAVLINPDKASAFTVDERVDMLACVAAGLENVEISSFSGLQVDYLRAVRASAAVRGLRTAQDFAAENELHAYNQILYPQMETVLFMTRAEYTHISSSGVKMVARLGGDISGFVPGCIASKIAKKFQNT